MKMPSTATRTRLLADSRPSAQRLWDYLLNRNVYTLPSIEIYSDMTQTSIQMFDHDLFRHDLHVTLYTRNALVGFVPPRANTGDDNR